MVLPALAPAGTILFEEGLHFIHGDVLENMLEISPDGFIKIPAHKATNEFGSVRENMTLELKCPCPVENAICVRYNIPVYYALHLLCQMSEKKPQKCWYASYSSDSVVVLEFKFQDQIWEKMLGKMKELYDKESIPIPKRKVQNRDEYRGLLENFCKITHL